VQKLPIVAILHCQGDLSEPVQHLFFLEIHLVAILILLSPLEVNSLVDVPTSSMLSNNAQLVIIIFVNFFKSDNILMIN